MSSLIKGMKYNQTNLSFSSTAPFKTELNRKKQNNIAMSEAKAIEQDYQNVQSFDHQLQLLLMKSSEVNSPPTTASILTKFPFR